jgi:predicted MPP superfamily phosphohydrolase
MTTSAFIARFAWIIAAWTGVHVYVGLRLARPARRWKRAAAVGFVLLVAVLPPLTLWLDRAVGPFPMKDALRWVGFTSIGFSSLLTFVFAVEDLARAFAWLVARATGSRAGPEVDRDRRLFLRNSVNLGVVTATGAFSAAEAGVAQSAPQTSEVRIPIAGLHPDLEGFRIVQVTDLHIGPTIKRDYAASVARAANALRPDLLAVTGDLADGQVAQVRGDVAPLRELAAPHGVFFVTGNHEYYYDPAGWLDVVRSFGWTPLLNEHRVIRRGAGTILLAGVTDYRAARYDASHATDPAGARAGAPPHDVSILLAHQPRSIFEASKARYDLQISGHTHGGQYFPASLLIHLFEPYVSGLHLHDATWIYVSRGAGYWGPPRRFGVPKEITAIVLTRG